LLGHERLGRELGIPPGPAILEIHSALLGREKVNPWAGRESRSVTGSC
jgi:hypothetical protein